MPTSHARIVRGLSIATIVISALAILAVAVAAVFMGFLGSYLSDPAFLQSLMYETDSYSSLTIDELSLVMSLGVGTIMVALVWSLVCSVVTLVGGIMDMRGASRPEKLGGAFGWAIAGAVASFLTGASSPRCCSSLPPCTSTRCATPPWRHTGSRLHPTASPPAMGSPWATRNPACMASPWTTASSRRGTCRGSKNTRSLRNTRSLHIPPKRPSKQQKTRPQPLNPPSPLQMRRRPSSRQAPRTPQAANRHSRPAQIQQTAAHPAETRASQPATAPP